VKLTAPIVTVLEPRPSQRIPRVVLTSLRDSAVGKFAGMTPTKVAGVSLSVCLEIHPVVDDVLILER